MLSEQEQQLYKREIDRQLESARTNRAVALGKTLSDGQKMIVEQIDSFIRQAEELRNTDLVGARGLSQKADVLARDLARSVR